MNEEPIASLYEPAIHFQQVSYTAGDAKILEGITGSFPKQKITTLVGPSGAGKTTLLRMCNGLISPTEGEIYLEGETIENLNPAALRRRAGMVMQSSPMIDGTVYDNLELPLKLQGKKLAEEEADEVLTKVGLDPKYLQHDSRNLSGGQQQKVSIARTLLNQSNILLLDEITSALDPASLHEVEQLILQLNMTHHITVIWITHNVDQAKRMGDYVWIMMGGRLVETGKIGVLDRTENHAVRSFLKGDSL